MNELSEHQIQDQILDYLKLKHIIHWRQNTGGMTREYKGKKSFIKFGHSGTSDILGILPDGKFLAIEVKSKKGKLTIYQEQFLKNISDNHGISIVARSLNDVVHNLSGMIGNAEPRCHYCNKFNIGFYMLGKHKCNNCFKEITIEKKDYSYFYSK